MNTITVKGFEYEIGELYMGEKGHAGYLVNHVDRVFDGGFVLQCGAAKYSTCTITKIARVGEITKAEVKMITRKCYKFDHDDVGCWFGLYDEGLGGFIVGNTLYPLSDCTNIILMKEA